MKRFFTGLILIACIISNTNAQISISAYGAASIPSGDFSNYYKTAFGFRGNIFYSSSYNTSFFLHSGYNVWQFNNDKFNDWFHESDGVGNFNLEIPITAIPVLVGIRYSRDVDTNSKIFLEAAAGMYLITTNASGTFTDNTGTYDLGNEKKNYTEFTLHFGGGTTYTLSGNLSLDAVVGLDYITNSEAAKQAKTKNSKEYYESNQVTTLVFCIGLNYKF
ncbi:MAG: hypothetical protein C0412_18055 [Flavobacterium sp.]|nr:hypothetical protein [Flavobacterium sp.]MDP2037087.1 hypothetical protein [Ignavibacteria bacterium]